MSAVVIFFFFQAEDGIRDLVRSRGLGDVYKRQPYIHRVVEALSLPVIRQAGYEADDLIGTLARKGAVSYTHLTLPTSDLV